jgi:ABC-type dipeptide/oligopeptide/nickel transport system permease component
VIYKHALRNALIPTFTVIGIYMSILIGGSVLTEIIFRRPGLGKMMLFEVKDRNYIAFQSVVIIFSAFVFLFNLLTDLLYSIIDLRIEYR